MWERGSIDPPFLVSALDGGEWSASRSRRFTLGEGTPGTHWIEGWVGPRACLDAVKSLASRYGDSPTSSLSP
jgi:hypothetical protein